MIVLLFDNLKKFVFSNKLIFIIFVLSLMISTIPVIYISSVFQANKQEELKYNDSLKSYKVQLSKDYGKDELTKILNSILSDNKNNIKQIILYSDKDKIKSNFIYPDKQYQFTQIGNYFKEIDFQQGEHQIIINDTSNEISFKTGDTYNIRKTSYKIIGIALINEYNEIPYKALDFLNGINRIFIKSEYIPSNNQANKMMEYLNSKITNANIEAPEKINYILSTKNVLEYSISIIVILLAMINISYLYRYILQRCKKQFAVMRICGCSKIKATLIFLLEVLFLAGIQFILCCLITHFGISKIFMYLNGGIKYSMTIIDYAWLFVIYSSTVIIVFLSIISKYVKKSIHKLL